MKKKYEAWIHQYKTKNPFMRGSCASATEQMKKKFSELTRVPGFVYTCSGFEIEHFWLEDSEGNIIDPTVSQFSEYGGVAEYKKWEPGDEVFVGRCMDCGDNIYACVETLNGERKTFCSKECENKYIAYMNS